MVKTIKKTFLSIILLLWISISSSFALEIHIPTDRAWDDIATRIESEDKKGGWGSISKGQWSTTISWNTNTLYNFINLLNEYLRWIFGAIATWLLIYAWYEAITAGGDHKVLKKAMRIIIWTCVWLAIAMLSVPFIKILVNLI